MAKKKEMEEIKIDYQKEYEKQKVILMALESENSFLKENLLKFEKMTAMSNSFLFKVASFLMKCYHKVKWTIYRVIRKMKNILKKVLRRGEKHG